MEFSEKMIVGEMIEDKEKILSLIKDGVRVYKTYLICINKKSDNLLEIIESTEICKPMYEEKNYLVIGIAENKKEAIRIVESIIKNHYSQNTNENLKKHILRKF